MAPVVLDTDVASLIIRQRLPSSLAAKMTGMLRALTFVTRAELNNWSVMRNWGLSAASAFQAMDSRASLDPTSAYF
jgi:toxin FitB